MNIITRLFGVVCDKCGRLVARRNALRVNCSGYAGAWWTEWYCVSCAKSEVKKSFEEDTEQFRD